jgi:hypothetical protein
MEQQPHLRLRRPLRWMRRVRRIAVAAILTPGLLALGAVAATPRSPAGTDVAVIGVAPDGAVSFVTDPGGAIEHVVAISIDGLRSDAITKLGEARAPHIHRLIREGASTLNARNLAEVTVTLPNHTAMITGRPASRRAGGTGVDFNADNGRTVHRVAGRYVESVFDVVHDAGGATGLYVGKGKFDFLDRSWNGANAMADTTGADDGRDKITDYVRAGPAAATEALTQQLRSDSPFAFSFLHLPQPDSVGHRSKWMSRRYLSAVEQADRLVGEVLAAIASSPERTADTAVILTTDHGGHKNGHGDRTRLENYRIPFIVWGPGIAAGADLYELNPDDRLDPGEKRPGYATVQPVRNGELANLATDLLDLPAVSGSRFNRAHDLGVFPPE